ncbi:MAG: hypothetical protein AAFQ66_15315 [Pseudomonadota bacterium]
MIWPQWIGLSTPMNLKKLAAKIRHFIEDEDGSATVDFVVLTSAGVLLAVAVLQTISGGVIALADEVSATLSSFEVVDYLANSD